MRTVDVRLAIHYCWDGIPPIRDSPVTTIFPLAKIRAADFGSLRCMMTAGNLRAQLTWSIAGKLYGPNGR